MIEIIIVVIVPRNIHEKNLNTHTYTNTYKPLTFADIGQLGIINEPFKAFAFVKAAIG